MSFFKNLFGNAARNPKTTVAGLASLVSLFLPKYAPLIASVSTAAIGILASDSGATGAVASGGATAPIPPPVPGVSTK